MTGLNNLLPVLPLLLTAAGSIVLLLVISIKRNHELSAIIALITLFFSFISAGVITFFDDQMPVRITGLLIIDTYSLYFAQLFTAASIATVVFTFLFFRTCAGRNVEEIYVLLLLATLGSQVLTAASHFASFILGLELISISLYAMIAFRRDMKGIEAGLKYLVLAGSSAAVLLFGMALIYNEFGTMQFSRISALAGFSHVNRLIVITGLVMIVAGTGFKLSLVPFHMWAPDIFQGSPPSIAGFISTVSKGAVFAVLVRFFKPADLQWDASLSIIFWILAVASMSAGNLLALLQRDIRRLLAYSSITHMGYILVAFLASGRLAYVAVAYYLTAYFITMLAAFGVITMVSLAPAKDNGRHRGECCTGLARKSPVLTGMFIISMLSLAGLPFTAGFIGKFLILTAGAATGYIWLIVIMVVNSAVSVFYYLRVILRLFAVPDDDSTAISSIPGLPVAGIITMAVLTLFLIIFGILPSPLIRLLMTLRMII